jgi:hypothetical protein
MVQSAHDIQQEIENVIKQSSSLIDVQPEIEEIIRQWYKDIREEYGLQVEYNSETKTFIYICNTCESRNEIKKLIKRSNYCNKCKLDSKKPKEDEIKTRIEPFGFTLVKYHTCKKVDVICPCSATATLRMVDMEKGGRCSTCKNMRIRGQ